MNQHLCLQAACFLTYSLSLFCVVHGFSEPGRLYEGTESLCIQGILRGLPSLSPPLSLTFSSLFPPSFHPISIHSSFLHICTVLYYRFLYL